MINELVKNKFKDIFDKKGYPFFERGNFNLNIIGVRSKSKISNSFDDLLYCIYKSRDIWQVKCFNITTDSGKHWLLNPLSVKGCAILVPNCYQGCYKLGKHKGKYTALVQTGGRVRVYRDNNKDNIIDIDNTTIERGYFGINIHKSKSSNILTDNNGIDKFSAGCQVFHSINEYDTFINLCQTSATYFGQYFTYTLLTYKDLEL